MQRMKDCSVGTVLACLGFTTRQLGFCTLVALLTCAATPAFAVDWEEIQLTSGNLSQEVPDIYENIVVYADTRNGNDGDIFSYDLLTQTETVITTGSSFQYRPAIYGDIVVWEEDTLSSRQIFGYDLSTNTKFQITSQISSKLNPDVFGDIVVWQDFRNGNWDIYGYDLSAGTEFQISSDVDIQVEPSIYGDIVVWEDRRNFDIYGYDLSTGTEFQIPTTPLNQSEKPQIHENLVVYEVLQSGTSFDIRAYDLSTDTDFVIVDAPDAQRQAAVYGDLVLWVDERNFSSAEIFGYEISTGTEFQVTSNGSLSNSFPAIWDKTAVWQDGRGSNDPNIFAAVFVPEPGTITLVGLGLVGLAARRSRRKAV